ncbi:hypothetical protein PGB90_004578 [Kerria lacca]
MEFIEDNHSEEIPNLQKYFQKIPGCASVMEEDVEKWVTKGDKVQELSDSDIAELVLSKETEDTEGCNTHPETDPKVSYDEAFSALEKSVEFIENQTGVTAQELLVRNFAAEKRLNSKIYQTRITDFFQK